MSGYIVAVGGACIDEYYNAPGWIDEGDKCLVKYEGGLLGGFIANAACVMAGYAEKVYLLAWMNKNDNTANILNLLREKNVDIGGVETREGLDDAKCIIIRTPAERSIFVMERERIWTKFSQMQRDIMDGADYIYSSLDSFGAYDDAVDIADSLINRGVKFAFDVEPTTFESGYEPLFERASILFFNESGFKKFCDCRCLDADSAVKGLIDAGVEYVAITRGERGCECFDAENRVAIPGVKVQVVDTTGAGDTFNSSFLHCIHKGRDLPYAARFANIAAANAVTKMGATGGICSDAEVAELMKAADANQME